MNLKVFITLRNIFNERYGIQIEYLLLFGINLFFVINYIYLMPLCYWFAPVDMHYYTSIADSIMGGIGFYDIWHDIPSPVITPQNGIVLIHLLLMKIGIVEQETRLQFIMILNYFSYIGSSFLIYRICNLFKIRPLITFLTISIFMLSGHILRLLLIPINDGIFFFLGMLLVYLVLRDYSREQIRNTIFIFLLSIIIIHFRNQGIFISFSAAVPYLILKKYKKALSYCIIGCLSYLNLHIFYIFCVGDLVGIKQGINDVLISVYNNFSTLAILGPFKRTLPVMLLGFGDEKYAPFVKCTFPIFLILFVVLILLWIDALRKREFTKIFLGFYVLVNIVAVYFSPGITPRFILITMPFVFMLFAFRFQNQKMFRNVLVTYLIYVMFLSFFRVYYQDATYNSKQNRLATKNALIHIPRQYVLISQNAGQSYFFFNKRANKNYDNIETMKNVLIFGDSDFRKNEILKVDSKFRTHEVLTFREVWMCANYGEKYKLVHLKIKGLRD